MRLYQLFRARNAVIASAVLLTAVSASGQQVSASGQGQPGQVSLGLAVQAAAQNAALQPGETVRRLSIDEAVKLAMEQNLGIKIQQFDPQIQDTGISLARSAWRPNLTSGISRNSQTQQSTNAFSGSGSSIVNGTVGGQLGIN